MISVVPIKRDTANEFVRAHHRHHGVPAGDLWRHAVQDDDGVIVGVAIVGRPVAEALDDGLTVEVTRLCTLGTPNACSMLYARARRTAIEKGYRRGLTYILHTESGHSLEVSGWQRLWMVAGRSWNSPSRPREDKHPKCDKIAYGWGEWPPELIGRRQRKYEADIARRDAGRRALAEAEGK